MPGQPQPEGVQRETSEYEPTSLVGRKSGPTGPSPARWALARPYRGCGSGFATNWKLPLAKRPRLQITTSRAPREFPPDLVRPRPKIPPPFATPVELNGRHDCSPPSTGRGRCRPAATLGTAETVLGNYPGRAAPCPLADLLSPYHGTGPDQERLGPAARRGPFSAPK